MIGILQGHAYNGSLQVTIMGARSLPDVRTLGTQSPYCTVTVGDSKFHTQPAHSGGTNPQWNETFTFHLDPLNKKQDFINFHVKDKNKLMDGKIGRADIKLHTLLDKSKASSTWIQLFHHENFNHLCGQIQISYVFKDSTNSSTLNLNILTNTVNNTTNTQHNGSISVNSSVSSPISPQQVYSPSTPQPPTYDKTGVSSPPVVTASAPLYQSSPTPSAYSSVSQQPQQPVIMQQQQSMSMQPILNQAPQMQQYQTAPVQMMYNSQPNNNMAYNPYNSNNGYQQPMQQQQQQPQMMYSSQPQYNSFQPQFQQQQQPGDSCDFMY